MKRVFAHKIIYAGKEYHMSVATINNKDVVIEPYEKETAGTIFVSGKILLQPTESGVEIIRLPL